MSEFVRVLFLLLCGHAVADYALQSHSMINNKNPNTEWTEAVYGPWWWTMTAHSLINGLAVYLATGGLLLPAILETVLHFDADRLKCNGRISTNTDQIIHLTCKVIWAAYATYVYQGHV